jgi:hypothetical protein
MRKFVILKDFDSTVFCTSYTVSTYSTTVQGYSYTDCGGVPYQRNIGGSGAYEEVTFCALTTFVDNPSATTLTNNGACP